MEINRFRVIAASAASVCALLTGCFDDKPSHTNEEVKPAYVLPVEIALNFSADRNAGAAITVVGSSNLPEGTRVDAELLSATGRNQGQSSMNVQGDGSFHSEEFTNGGHPWPSGKHKVHVYAYFNAAWQSDQILQITGEGGKKLKGQAVKAQDSDVIDSDKIIDVTKVLDFPHQVSAVPQASKGPVGKEEDAIEHVKYAVLSVDGQRSATNLDTNVELFMQSPGLHSVRGWSAKKSDTGNYLVSYDFQDGENGEQQAIWEFDPATRKVRYVNKNAKIMSWTPAD